MSEVPPFPTPDNRPGPGPSGPQYGHSGGDVPSYGQPPSQGGPQPPTDGSPYGSPPSYPGGPGGYPGTPPSQSTNVLAIVSLILGIISIVTCNLFIFGIGGLVLGFIALNQIKSTGAGGRGLALGGLIASGVGLALGLLVVILYLVGVSRYGYL